MFATVAALVALAIVATPAREFRTTDSVSGLRFNSVESRLLMVAEGHDFAHYDVDAGRRLWLHDEWQSKINVLAMAPDGRTVAIGTQPFGFYLYDVYEERVIRSASYQVIGGIRAMEFSPDGRYIAVGGIQLGTVTLLDRQTLAVVDVLRGTRYNPELIKFSANGRYLMAGDSSTMYVWDLQQGTQVRRLGSMCLDRTFDFSSDLNYVATCRADDIEVLDVETGARVALLEGHSSSSVSTVLFASSCCIISAGGESGSEDSIRVWDLTERREIQRIDLGTNFTTAMALSPDGRLLAVGGSDFVRIYRVIDQ